MFDEKPSPAARANEAEIDLDALEANLGIVRELITPDIRIIASVKASAYGHGLREVATRLEKCGVPAFSTGSLADAYELRRGGIRGEILMFGGALPEAMPELIAADVIPTAHTIEIAEAVSRYASKRYPVYVKVDAGFGRLGVPLSRARRFIETVASLKNVEVRGVYTHVPFGDTVGRDWASERLGAFDSLIADLRKGGIEVPVTQARATSCLLGGLKDRCNAINPGGMLYGRSPLDAGMNDIETRLKPVLRTVRTRVIHISDQAADKNTPYPSRHAGEVKRATGVVPFGRVDGNRAAVAGETAYMLIDGVKVRVLGVSSEHCVVDLSDVPNVKIGDEVIVIGRSGSERIVLNDVARFQATTGSDILLALRGRMNRVYVS